MTWRIELKPSAEKQYLRLDQKTRRRVKSALKQLEAADRSLSHPHVRRLTGQLKGDFRLRVGGWRLLFTPEEEKGILSVYAILPRGDAY